MVGSRLMVFLILPLMMFLFVIPQSFYVAFRYSDYVSLLILFVSVLSVVFYFVGGFLAFKVSRVREVCLSGWGGVGFRFFVLLYFVSYLCLYYSYGGVPILELILHGGNPSVMRAEFHKMQEGGWQVFAYLRSILTRGFIPFAMIVLFCIKGRVFFYLFLIAFTFTAVSAMEKSLLLWGYLPVLFYTWVSGYKKDFWRVLLFAIAFLAFVSIVSFGRGGEVASYGLESDHSYVVYAPNEVGYIKASCQECNKLPVLRKVSLREQADYQFLFYDLNEGGVHSYLFNRFFWIPFVTVYDTFYYWRVTYDDYLFFSVNRYLSILFGVEFADLERNVFRFQFGSGEESKGNSNAAYISEAYVGFGFPGVFLFSLVVGCLFGWVVKGGVPPFVFALPVIAFGLISVSLLSMFFSGGLFLFVLSVFLFTRKMTREG